MSDGRSESRPIAELIPNGPPTEVGDFGGIIRGRALGTVAPRNAEELRSLVRLARGRGVGLTARGLGSSQSGQAVADECVQVSFEGLRAVGSVQATSTVVRCEAGATFEDVLRETLAVGKMPAVVPLNPDLSVGGVLSAGGLGSSSHHHGFAACCVEELTVVLGDGSCVVASSSQNRDVYDCVLGGLGRYGLIAEVALRLVPVPPQLVTTTLLYEDCESMLNDQLVLSAKSEVLHLEGVSAGCVLGMRKADDGRPVPLRRWSYALHFTVESEARAEEILGAQNHVAVLNTQTDSSEAYLRRYQPRFRMMRASGAWEQTHPWFEALVSPDGARELLTAAQSMPPFFGDMIRVATVRHEAIPAGIAVPTRNSISASHFFSVAVLPAGIPQSLVDFAKAALRALDDRLSDVGGKRYLSGWLCEPTVDTWRRHYGSEFERLEELQRRYNPGNVLRSRLNFLI